MYADGLVALGLYMIDPFSSLLFVMLSSGSLIDPDYRGFFVVALFIFTVSRQLIKWGMSPVK